MKSCTSNRVAGACLLIAIASIGSGCADSPRSDADGAYRTVRTEPLRDTESAKNENQLGMEHLDKNDLEKAGEAFRRALTADVSFGPAHNNLGKVYYKQKDSYKAAWEFEYAAKLMPKRGEPRNNLGLVLEDVGELDRAVDSYREAAKLEPDNIQYRGNLARALIRRGDRTDEVRGLLVQIIERDSRPEWLIWAKQQQASMGRDLK